MAIQLVSLLEENFALFSGNFLTNCSADILLVAVSERLDNKAYHRLGKHIKIRRSLLYRTVVLKKLKMFRENIRNLLQYLSLVTLFFEECFSFFSGKAISRKQLRLLVNVSICLVNQILNVLISFPKQRHSLTVFEKAAVLKNFTNFIGQIF